ncbi:hypothetical protein E5S69_31585 [Cupriavidus necator]|uniref:hypothetical protein n=1 Tax=Cupriavidus necator TaxID=106590 RepID=UPI00148F83C7|nr:hypothetical protein [Cupriavidus necator]NOV28030.1 hypothetical protein [Cupriavidus necator]
MRTINDHVINPANDKLTIAVTDEPGAGGANHRYEISGMKLGANPSGGKLHRMWQQAKEYFAGSARHSELTMAYQDRLDRVDTVTVLFQNGPIPEVGVNGITQEVLLAIVADRLRSFQAGPFACRENALALTKIEEAQHWLQQRTIARMRRGVEGTHQV